MMPRWPRRTPRRRRAQALWISRCACVSWMATRLLPTLPPPVCCDIKTSDIHIFVCTCIYVCTHVHIHIYMVITNTASGMSLCQVCQCIYGSIYMHMCTCICIHGHCRHSLHWYVAISNFSISWFAETGFHSFRCFPTSES